MPRAAARRPLTAPAARSPGALCLLQYSAGARSPGTPPLLLAVPFPGTPSDDAAEALAPNVPSLPQPGCLHRRRALKLLRLWCEACRWSRQKRCSRPRTPKCTRPAPASQPSAKPHRWRSAGAPADLRPACGAHGALTPACVTWWPDVQGDPAPPAPAPRGRPRALPAGCWCPSAAGPAGAGAGGVTRPASAGAPSPRAPLGTLSGRARHSRRSTGSGAAAPRLPRRGGGGGGGGIPGGSKAPLCASWPRCLRHLLAPRGKLPRLVAVAGGGDGFFVPACSQCQTRPQLSHPQPQPACS